MNKTRRNHGAAFKVQGSACGSEGRVDGGGNRRQTRHLPDSGERVEAACGGGGGVNGHRAEWHEFRAR